MTTFVLQYRRKGRQIYKSRLLLVVLFVNYFMNGAKPPTQAPHKQVRHVHFQWLRVVEDKREGRAKPTKRES
jgi:hypothetical protein